MKIFKMLKRFKNLESIESAIANAQTELNKTLTQSASVKDEYERKSNELNSTLPFSKSLLGVFKQITSQNFIVRR